MLKKGQAIYGHRMTRNLEIKSREDGLRKAEQVLHTMTAGMRGGLPPPQRPTASGSFDGHPLVDYNLIFPCAYSSMATMEGPRPQDKIPSRKQAYSVSDNRQPYSTN